MKPKQVLSLGAGVQSTTLFLMSVAGEVDRLDAVIFADTQWEPKPVYEHLENLRRIAKKNGIEIITVSEGNLREDALKSTVGGRRHGGERWASMPLYTLMDDGRRGMIRRQCTGEYKIRPIKRGIRKWLGVGVRGRVRNNAISQWFGITVDELYRVKDSRVKWIKHRYPLVFENPMTRGECKVWLERNGFAVPMRSACCGCPYRSDREWKELRERDPEGFQGAVDFDKRIRNQTGDHAQAFLHSSRKPLDEVDFSDAEDQGQLDLFNNECEGMCGV